jgi:hypothetical protein
VSTYLRTLVAAVKTDLVAQSYAGQVEFGIDQFAQEPRAQQRIVFAPVPSGTMGANLTSGGNPRSLGTWHRGVVMHVWAHGVPSGGLTQAEADEEALVPLVKQVMRAVWRKAATASDTPLAWNGIESNVEIKTLAYGAEAVLTFTLGEPIQDEAFPLSPQPLTPADTQSIVLAGGEITDA